MLRRRLRIRNDEGAGLFFRHHRSGSRHQGDPARTFGPLTGIQHPGARTHRYRQGNHGQEHPGEGRPQLDDSWRYLLRLQLRRCRSSQRPLLASGRRNQAAEGHERARRLSLPYRSGRSGIGRIQEAPDSDHRARGRKRPGGLSKSSRAGSRKRISSSSSFGSAR